MTDEFEQFRKRSYHGGIDLSKLCTSDPNGTRNNSLNSISNDDRSVTFRVPPLKRSRSHPIGSSRFKSARGKSEAKQKQIENYDRPTEPIQPFQPQKDSNKKTEFSLLCHKHNTNGASPKKGLVNEVLHSSYHSLVLLPRVGDPCHICQGLSMPQNKHTRIISTAFASKKRREGSERKKISFHSEPSTPKGRRSASVDAPKIKERTASLQPPTEPVQFKIRVLGHQGVGKATLVKMFATADDVSISQENEDYSFGAHVSILGDGREDVLALSIENLNQFDDQKLQADAVVVLYAVDDKRSFEEATSVIKLLRNGPSCHDIPIVLAANKGDIVRTRVVRRKGGRDFAAKYRCKYVEVSAILNIHVDELFLGVLAQAHFAKERLLKKISSDSNMVVHRKPPITIRAMGYIGKLWARYRDLERDIDELFMP